MTLTLQAAENRTTYPTTHIRNAIYAQWRRYVLTPTNHGTQLNRNHDAVCRDIRQIGCRAASQVLANSPLWSRIQGSLDAALGWWPCAQIENIFFSVPRQGRLPPFVNLSVCIRDCGSLGVLGGRRGFLGYHARQSPIGAKMAQLT